MHGKALTDSFKLPFQAKMQVNKFKLIILPLLKRHRSRTISRHSENWRYFQPDGHCDDSVIEQPTLWVTWGMIGGGQKGIQPKQILTVKSNFCCSTHQVHSGKPPIAKKTLTICLFHIIMQFTFDFIFLIEYLLIEYLIWLNIFFYNFVCGHTAVYCWSYCLPNNWSLN